METLTHPLEDLQLSHKPAVRSAQIRVAKTLFQFFRSPADSSKANRALVMELAELPALKEAFDAYLGELPASPARGSFDDMLAQRDASGLLRHTR